MEEGTSSHRLIFITPSFHDSTYMLGLACGLGLDANISFFKSSWSSLSKAKHSEPEIPSAFLNLDDI